jgi:hypothetical protein
MWSRLLLDDDYTIAGSSIEIEKPGIMGSVIGRAHRRPANT